MARHSTAEAGIVIAAGVCAALHVAKLPPAIGALQQALGLTLVQAGVLLSLVQAAGMLLGVVFGAAADALGARRSMVLGSLGLALASALGAAASSLPALLALRVLEGFGFLLVVLPAPGLVRSLVPPERVHATMGVWGTYMPLGTALALLAGPGWMAAFGWRAWWAALGGVSLAMAWALHAGARTPDAPRPPNGGRADALRATLGHAGPWLVAATFAMYSAQWLAVVGFLPTMAQQAGLAAGAVGGLTALAAAANIVGNLAGGRLLQRGVAPTRLLTTGFVTMALAAAAAFGTLRMSADGAASGASASVLLWRYAAVLVFSGVGGMIPATLFALALRVAPSPGSVAATVGWMQQWSALGQFAGPPLVAWVASRAGGWQFTWVVTAACAAAGCTLAWALQRRFQAPSPTP